MFSTELKLAQNVANTCYMNSLLQSYFQDRVLRTILIYAVIDEALYPVLANLQALMQQMQLGRGDSVNPRRLAQALGINTGIQCDAGECVKFESQNRSSIRLTRCANLGSACTCG